MCGIHWTVRPICKVTPYLHNGVGINRMSALLTYTQSFQAHSEETVQQQNHNTDSFSTNVNINLVTGEVWFYCYNLETNQMKTACRSVMQIYQQFSHTHTQATVRIYNIYSSCIWFYCVSPLIKSAKHSSFLYLSPIKEAQCKLSKDGNNLLNEELFNSLMDADNQPLASFVPLMKLQFYNHLEN